MTNAYRQMVEENVFVFLCSSGQIIVGEVKDQLEIHEPMVSIMYPCALMVTKDQIVFAVNPFSAFTDDKEIPLKINGYMKPSKTILDNYRSSLSGLVTPQSGLLMG